MLRDLIRSAVESAARKSGMPPEQLLDDVTNTVLDLLSAERLACARAICPACRLEASPTWTDGKWLHQGRFVSCAASEIWSLQK